MNSGRFSGCSETTDSKRKQIQTSTHNILKHTSPSKVSENITALNYLLVSDPRSRQDFNQSVDNFPLEVNNGTEVENNDNKPYINTEFNRITGDDKQSESYRPPMDEKSNTLEGYANELFRTYTQMYYGRKAVSSVYLSEKWNSKQEQPIMPLFVCIAISNSVEMSTWNSVHIVEILRGVTSNRQEGTMTGKIDKATYKVESSIYVSLDINEGTTASGITRKQIEKEIEYDEADISSHLPNIGRLVEDIEFDVRSSIDRLFIHKTIDLATTEVRQNVEKEVCSQIPGRMHTMMLNQAILSRSLVQSDGQD